MMSKKAGLPPGTMIHVGERRREKTAIQVIYYNDGIIEEKELDTIDECYSYCEKPGVAWVNVDGLHDTAIIQNIGTRYNLHPLILEDIVNTEQRPKYDDMDDYLFIVTKMISYNPAEDYIKFEQISFILLKNLIISFQEDRGDVFDQVRERLRKGKGRIRKMGSDYLMYSLMDAIVDNYFGVVEKIGEKIENIEDDLVAEPEPETLKMIYKLKRELLFLRRSVWPLRDIISNLERGESALIDEKNLIFFRDIYDHTVRVIETIETCRDIVSGMMDLFLSSVSNKMNNAMKMLSVFATVFIPLTLVAGIYGMNFEHMPELKWRWGYPGALVFMLIAGLLILFWFKKKKIL